MTQRTCFELLERGDHAASSGDAATLADVALQLSSRIGAPLAASLLELARDCRHRVARAQHSWPPLRHAVAHRISIAGT